MDKNGREILFFQASELQIDGITKEEVGKSAPDTMGAAGLVYFVEIVNGKIKVFQKSNGASAGETPTTTFFALPDGQGGLTYPSEIADARILYDSAEDRWVVSGLYPVSAPSGQVDPGTGHIILAVSRTASPLPLDDIGWKKYLLPMNYPENADYRPDYPTLGLDSQGIYLSWAYGFRVTGNTWYSHDVIALDKEWLFDLQILDASHYNRFYQDPTALPDDPNRWDIGAFTILPAFNFDPTPVGGLTWFLAKAPPGVGSSGGAIYYRALSGKGAGAHWVTGWEPLTEHPYGGYFDFDVNTISAPYPLLDGQQTQGIELSARRGGSRLAMPVMRNGHLWTCHHIGLDVLGSGSINRSGIQWIEMRANIENQTAPTLDYVAHGRVYDGSGVANPKWYYYPSLMVNSQGVLALGFSGSGSSANAFISAYYAMKPNGGAMGIPQVFKHGLDYFAFTFWGDYSATSLDPVDGTSFWTAQEYAKAGTEELYQSWGTWITRMSLTP